MTFVDPRAPVQRRAQSLAYINGYAVPGERSTGLKPEVSAPPPAPEQLKETTLPMSTLPKFVAFDRKVLRWNCYFKESVTESAVENHRVRKCTIYMYLEDESVHVEEPRQPNSGIPQGVFLKRHRVPKDNEGGVFGPADISVGSTCTMYGRTFFVVSCDAFTREYLTGALGLEVAPDGAYPDDPIDGYRATLKKDTSANPYPPAPRDDVLAAYIEAAAGKPSNALAPDKLKKFLANDRKVLRFFAVWDDRGALYGEKRPFVVHYYLADDSVEVLEVSEPNSGRDPFPVFLRRQPLPNKPLEVDALGPTKSTTTYTHKDFVVGQYVKVYNRDFYLYDADNFTKAWYIENEGMSAADFPEIDVEEKPLPIPQNAVPPYNGFGGLEDSLQNCIALIPKPVAPDFHKQMDYARTILRYKAKIAPGEQYELSDIDAERDFILSVYLANDTIAIYEPPDRKRNIPAHITGGKFLERQTVLKPGSAEKYEAHDLYVGAVVSVFRRNFVLTEADEYSYQFMEQHPASFPRSDFDQVLMRIRAQLEGMEAEVYGTFAGKEVTEESLTAALSACGAQFVKQEVVTVLRKVAGSGDAWLAALGFQAPA
ncbi:protofilament ribbon protein of flagellar microtubules [Micromonas commoda]|uniref:Protofilament ribbon protein of flagellar microtubules n=1 Tax=Micromonas commoda (strain RCC299 / NOUM17 / CCMP2709) TaxID=296587 RepID=C1E8N6_MICCC|nr:protofilament ribbon protein of flagellar microtubules [Micromonas commoda]ACO64543.1 protofilament ribbon protein of flagellar microtubules [Micromonas commoda]|eukprot:XP_002503285.1 protofilament ribbon protein of flagellar microtubules [Micromonas commoda]